MRNVIAFSNLAALALALLIQAAPGRCEEQDSLHGAAWAFGQSPQRQEDIWHKGVDAATVAKRANHAQKNRSGATDTTAAIDRALNEAEKKSVRGSLGMSMANESSTWKVTPDQKQVHPDEYMFRDRRHVVRAFADVKAGEDLNISIGPELSLKDGARANEAATEDQPESSLGVGMRFKLDF